MEFALSEEQEAIFDLAYSFGQENIAPFSIDWENQGTIPKELWAKTSELGFGGIYVSEEYGGSGLSRLDATLIFEALAMACPSVGSFLSIHNMVGGMIDKFGSTENKDLFLKGGMTVEIEITTDNILAYEMSPVHLSVNSDGVLYTKIVKNDEVTYKNVTIVNSGENLVNVTGLNDGDIVLTNGQAFVSLNDKIQYKIEN